MDWTRGQRSRRRKAQGKMETKTKRRGKGRLAAGSGLLLPIGAGAHLTGDQELGMDGEGYAGRVWDAWPL
jgi:hypothetical protein